MKNITSKEEIVDVALKMFLKNGYNDVTIQNICDEIGITRPTFYKYANSKEDLIIDIYDRSINDIVVDSLSFVKAESSYEQFVMILAKLINDAQQYGPELFSALLMANLVENRGSFALREEMTKLSVEALRRAQMKDEIANKEDPAIIYNAIAMMYGGLQVNWCIAKVNHTYDEKFFEDINVLLGVKEEYKDLYKKYFQNCNNKLHTFAPHHTCGVMS